MGLDPPPLVTAVGPMRYLLAPHARFERARRVAVVHQHARVCAPGRQHAGARKGTLPSTRTQGHAQTLAPREFEFIQTLQRV